MGITISPWMMAFLMLMTGFAGFVDSAAGGGGLISLPAYLFAGLPPHYTYATNKFSAACGTTFATANFFKSGAINVKVGVLAAIGSFAGSALGAHIVLLLSDEMLRTMMFIILPVAAVIILWQRNLPDENRDDGTLDLKKILLALAIGLGIGLYDGVMGPGTGTFAIIAFTTLMGFDLRTANGNGKVLESGQQLRQPVHLPDERSGSVPHRHPLRRQQHSGQPAGLPFCPEKGCPLHPPHDAGGAGSAAGQAHLGRGAVRTGRDDSECAPRSLCASVAERIFLFVVPKRLRAFRNYFSQRGVVEKSSSCSAAFCESAALREATSPSPSAHCVRIHLSQRERLWRNRKPCGSTGNFAAMPRALPLGELAR